MRYSKYWRARRQRITESSEGESARPVTINFLDSAVSLATCGRELWCARRCCPRSARRGGRKPRRTREPFKTVTPTPTDWWVNKAATFNF